MPRASLIISVYNNTLFLKTVLDSVKEQTFKDFEIIISEDAESALMKTFVGNYSFENPYQHLTQKDSGWNKNKALNRAIMAAKSDYLVFIDGDCVLHPQFMEQHIAHAKPSLILGGRRLKLNEKLTQLFLENSIKPSNINQSLIFNILLLKKRKILFPEEGFYINSKGLLGFIPFVRRLKRLTGCNMSFYKKAILDINGFDEDYIRPAIGEDIDLTWRFLRAGYHLYSVRNLAVEYHLYHKVNWVNQDLNSDMMRERQNKDLYRCINGIEKLSL